MARPTVTEEMVEQLAALAGLTLEPDRLPVVAEALDGLLGEADAVNRFMDARREVPPAVRFEHPAIGDDAG